MIDRFSISSPDFENHGLIPERFTCEGSDINPEIHIHYTPPGTKSLVLIMDDPDASSGGVFIHWLVWNIPPDTKVIKRKELPPGAVEGFTSFEKNGYGGPCPKPGKIHRYDFKLYALGRMLDLPPSSRVQDLEREIHAHLVGKADQFLGKYKRESVLY
ncbi:MAG: YbhB/YbcL family Raf kinase inhibitor-like protein [Anaplasmataceae bacterium]|nr:YbhB/YbcL family Raf kinase inhibitor-like protein [Anaplasmataceae bacterium]